MKDSGNPDSGRKAKKPLTAQDEQRQKKRSIVWATLSVAVLGLLLLSAAFIAPILARQTSGEILTAGIERIVIESGNAKIEMGSRPDTEVIQYSLTGSAEMKWLVDEGTLLIRADEGSLRVSLPKGLELDSLRILSTSKDIELTDIDAEVMELINSSDGIRLLSSDSRHITASAEGTIEFRESTAEEAEFTSDSDIRIKDSSIGFLRMIWNDDRAETENTYADRIDAESIDGKLELGISNGISSIILNGEDVSVYPTDYLGAAVTYDTEKGELRTAPGTARIED